MRIRLAVPDAAVQSEVLDAALEAVTRTNERLLDAGQVPTATEAIASGVRWTPEPPGDEHFDHAGTVVARGHGDCDDLAPYHAASLRHTGEDDGAKAIVVRSGPQRWHAVVQRSDGSIDDPSAEAGMYEYHAPVQPRLRGAHDKAHIASKKVNGVWMARCDVPWKGSRHALSGHALARSQSRAVADAIEGCVVVGDSACVVEPAILARLAAFHSILHGAPLPVVREFMRETGQAACYEPLVRAMRGMTPLSKLPNTPIAPGIARHWAQHPDVTRVTDVTGYDW